MKLPFLSVIFAFVIPVLGDSNSFTFPPSYAGPNNQPVCLEPGVHRRPTCHHHMAKYNQRSDQSMVDAG